VTIDEKLATQDGKKQQLFTPDWRTGVSEKDEENCPGRLLILLTLSAFRHSLRPHPGTTVSQKKQLTWGEFRCIYTFRIPAYLALSVLRNVWKIVLTALYG